MFAFVHFQKAFTLKERIERHSSAAGIPEKQSKQIRQRLRWLTKKFFDGDRKSLHRHLKVLGINTTADAHKCLVEISWARLDCPEWMKSWPDAFSLQKVEEESFSEIEILCKEIIHNGLRHISGLLKDLSSAGHILNNDQLIIDYNRHLYQNLAALMTPTVILETNLFRLRSKSATFPILSYRDWLREPEIRLQFWNKYPVLLRLVTTVAKNITDACVETIERIAADRPFISEAFGIHSDQAVESIEWGSGDAHKKGRVVAIIHFTNGNLVYKPRPMSVDVSFNAFLDWFNAAHAMPMLSSCKILDRETYGYAAFLQTNPCGDEEEIETFYYRIGLLTAIAWLLGITDLHHENLMACGSMPYLVDVEAMLDRPIRQPRNRRKFDALYSQASRDLLFRTGLLPHRMKSSEGVFDISAIGANGNQTAPVEVMAVENFGTDQVRIVYKTGTIVECHNNPSPNNPDHKAHAYVKHIVAGHNAAIKFLCKQKKVLLSADGPLKSFQDIKVRWVPRATMDYAKILERMTHPTVLGDAVDCDMLIAGDLWQTYDYAPHVKRLIGSELADLWNHDIPYFWSMASSKDLMNSEGDVIRNLFDRDGLSEMKARIKHLDHIAVAQSSAITLSLASTAPVVYAQSLTTSVQGVSSDEALQLAIEIGDDLIHKAHYIERTPFWVGMTPIDQSHYTCGVLPPTLYDGAPGIGVFLGHLYAQTKQARFGEVATDIHNHIRFLFCEKSGVDSVGAFSGLSSLLYADLQMVFTLGHDVSAEGEQVFDALAKMVEYDYTFDIISGSAGALIVALRYFHQTGNVKILPVAQAAAERLAATALPQKYGVAWDTMKSFNFPQKLGGVSHGATGIAWALSEWAQHTGEEKWAGLAKDAFSYEQSLFDPQAGAWIDARDGSHSCFWCYGAAGIGLAAHKMKPTLGEFVCDDVIGNALTASWNNQPSGNHCLCHGSFGNAEIFRSSGDPERAAALVASAVADYRKNKQWFCGMPGGEEVPGLMCGTSGIGYGLLRHAFADRLPNLLTLDVPYFNQP